MLDLPHAKRLPEGLVQVVVFGMGCEPTIVLPTRGNTTIRKLRLKFNSYYAKTLQTDNQ
jgi:hypothetical protein